MSKEKISILLAEDDRNLGNLLREYLEAKGYETKLATNGKEAFDFFNKESAERTEEYNIFSRELISSFCANEY